MNADLTIDVHFLAPDFNVVVCSDGDERLGHV